MKKMMKDRFKPVDYLKRSPTVSLTQKIKKKIKALMGRPDKDEIQRMLEESW